MPGGALVCLEARIDLRLRFAWLGWRGGHRLTEVVAANPAHQLPTLRHGGFGLGETSATVLYLADISGQLDARRWLRRTDEARAVRHRYLSWYHANLRQKVTLDYYLPVFMAPYYTGEPGLADLLFAPELLALDLDPAVDTILGPHVHLGAWLERLRPAAVVRGISSDVQRGHPDLS